MDLDRRLRRRLKLRHLDALVAVSQHGSMARAAAALSISQPAISKAITEMEGTLGVRLFDRTAQGVEPNLYGRALLKWALAAFDDVRQGVKEIEFLTDPSAGEVRVGASEPMMAGFIPAIIERIHQAYPRISIQVRHVPPAVEQTRTLRDRDVDLVIGRLAVPFDADIEAEVLFHERAFVVGGPNNHWVGRKIVRLVDLMSEPWMLPPANTVIGNLTADAFHASGLEVPRASVDAGSMQLYSALMASGPYLSILPGSMLHFSAKRLSIKALPVDIPIALGPAGIVRLKNRAVSAAALAFIDCAREVAKSVPSGPQRTPRAQANQRSRRTR